MTCRDFRQSPSDESPSRRACRMITSSCHPSVIIIYCLIIVIDTHKDRERGDVEVKKRLIVKVNISCDHIFNIGLPVSYQPETAPAQPRPLRPLEPHSTVKHCSNNRYQVGGYNNAMFGSYQTHVSREYHQTSRVEDITIKFSRLRRIPTTLHLTPFTLSYIHDETEYCIYAPWQGPSWESSSSWYQPSCLSLLLNFSYL